MAQSEALKLPMFLLLSSHETESAISQKMMFLWQEVLYEHAHLPRRVSRTE